MLPKLLLIQNTKATEIENKIRDVSDFGAKQRSINTKVTSKKTRQHNFQ